MTSGTIWYSKAAVNLTEINLSDNSFVNELFFRPSGSVGEYSAFFLVLGGLYLLFRRRISWHIPLAAFAVFATCLFILPDYNIRFSLGGLLLGVIFMATDMPSSPSTKYGKCFYGGMLGVIAILFIINGARFEYMSYSILLMNAFTWPINWVFRPRPWATRLDVLRRSYEVLLLMIGILITTFAIVYIHQINGIHYLLYVYILCSIGYFIAIDIRTKSARQTEKTIN